MFVIEKSGSETLISNLKGGDLAAPRIATTTNGQFRVVWDGANIIGEQTIGANGAPLGEAFIRADQGQLIFPLNGGGTFTLTDGGISGNYILNTAAGDIRGNTLFLNFGGGLGNSRFTRIVDTATDDQGGMLLLLRAQTIQAGNLASDVSYVVRVDALGRESTITIGPPHSDVYALAGGGFATVRVAGSVSTVVVYDAGNLGLGTASVSNGPVTGVTVSGDGHIVVVTESGGDVFQQVFGPGGVTQGPTLVHAAGASAQGGSSVLTLGDGSYVIGWTDGDAWVRLYNPDGTPASEPVRVDAATNLEQMSLVLRANPIGGFTAVWLEGAGNGEAPSLIKDQVFVTGQVGTAGADSLTGGPGGERVDGGDGGDRLVLNAGDDRGLGGAGNDTILAGAGADTISGGAGDDLMDGGPGFDYADYRDAAIGVRVDLTALTSSGEGSDQLAGIEGVYGSMAGGDTITGNYLGNLVLGYGGDDRIDGDSANDYLDGGAGTDTLVLFGQLSDYFVTAAQGGGTTVSGAYGTSTVFNFERVAVAGTTLSWSDFQGQAFNGLRYIASNTDLISRFGTDANAARQHWTSTGQAEGRALTSFDPLRYAASNPDLRAQFGIDTAALTRHWITTGFAEGRSATSFDPLQYGAANPDLLRAFGVDPAAFTRHFVVSAAAEGRAASGFDPLLYGASNDDLARLFGTDSAALFDHWIRTGALEERETATFDGLQYAAANDDLARAFGTDTQAALTHYLQAGADEGRQTSGFDAVAYMLSYGDLQTGGGPQAAFDHWLAAGADQMRLGDELFGRDQESHALAISQPVSGALESRVGPSGRLNADQDWFGLTLAAGTKVLISLRGAGSGDGTLADPRLAIHDPNGRLVRSDDNGGGSGLDAEIVFTAPTSGTFYVVVASPGYGQDGTYLLEVVPQGSAPAEGWIV